MSTAIKLYTELFVANVHEHVFELLNISQWQGGPLMPCALGTAEQGLLGCRRQRTKGGVCRPTMNKDTLDLSGLHTEERRGGLHSHPPPPNSLIKQ